MSIVVTEPESSLDDQTALMHIITAGYNQTTLLNEDHKALIPDHLMEQARQGKRLVAGYASTIQPDRDKDYAEGGDVILPTAYQKSLNFYLKSNPILRLNHMTGTIIGGVEHATITPEGLFVVASISSRTDRATEAWGLVQDGYLRSFSVMIIPERTRYEMFGGIEYRVIEDGEIIELAIVDIPANPLSTFMTLADLDSGNIRKKLKSVRKSLNARWVDSKETYSPVMLMKTTEAETAVSEQEVTSEEEFELVAGEGENITPPPASEAQLAAIADNMEGISNEKPPATTETEETATQEPETPATEATPEASEGKSTDDNVGKAVIQLKELVMKEVNEVQNAFQEKMVELFTQFAEILKKLSDDVAEIKSVSMAPKVSGQDEDAPDAEEDADANGDKKPPKKPPKDEEDDEEDDEEEDEEEKSLDSFASQILKQLKGLKTEIGELRSQPSTEETAPSTSEEDDKVSETLSEIVKSAGYAPHGGTETDAPERTGFRPPTKSTSGGNFYERLQRQSKNRGRV